MGTRKNRYVPLTVAYLAAHLNEPIRVYERQIGGSVFDVTYTFTASGDARIRQKDPLVWKMQLNWLKTRTPTIRANTMLVIAGVITDSKELGTQESILHAGPSGKVSTNLMNTEAFIKL